MTKRLTITLALAMGFSSLAAWAQTPPTDPPKPMMPPGPGVVCPVSAMMIPSLQTADNPPPILELNATQRTQIKDILTKAHASIKPLRDAASKASADLFAAVVATDSDAAKVQPLKDAAQKCEADILKVEVDTWTQIKAVLTPDQIKRIAVLSGPRRVMPGQFPHGGPGIPGGPNPGGPANGIQGKTDPTAPPVTIEAPPPAPGQ